MILPRLRWFILALVLCPFALLYWSIAIQPRLALDAYQQRWTERLSSYQGDGSIPEAWTHDVGRRLLPSGEWILAAMYHGACAPGPEGEFNGSVILDSAGAVHRREWSPCAGGISDLLDYWKELEPADDLASLYSSHTEWVLVRPARTKPSR
jgi:hypothetical protein